MCASGSCIDGVCCNQAACSADERCDVFQFEGECRPRLGIREQCDKNTDCNDQLLCSFDPNVGAFFCDIPRPPTPAACIGDCDGSGEVTIPDLTRLVNVALGTLPVSACFAGDSNNDGIITVAQ